MDGHKLLASGFNVSVGHGRLALQLSYSPLASNQTGPRVGLGTALTAQFKGQIILTVGLICVVCVALTSFSGPMCRSSAQRLSRRSESRLEAPSDGGCRSLEGAWRVQGGQSYT